MPAVDPPNPPWTVRVAAVLALLQAVGSAAFAVRFLVEVLPLEEPRGLRAGYAFGVVAFVGGAAAVLVVAARALRRLRLWSRSLLVVAQLMALAVGIPMAQGDDWIGWPVAVTGVVGLVLLLHPTTTTALEQAERGA